MKIRPVRTELFCVDGQQDLMKPIVFRNFCKRALINVPPSHKIVYPLLLGPTGEGRRGK